MAKEAKKIGGIAFRKTGWSIIANMQYFDHPVTFFQDLLHRAFAGDHGTGAFEKNGYVQEK